MDIGFARLAIALFGLCLGALAAAQSPYPTKPVRLIIPYPPGGSTDIVGRELAQHLSAAWGHQVIVDNRPGAGSQIGIAIGSRASTDGYTITFGTSATLAVNPALGVKMPFEPHSDFAPIGMIVYVPFFLAVTPSLPANNIKQLIDLAKAQPGKLNFASPGVGTSNHLGIEMLNSMAGIKLVHVPYKGGAPAVADLVGGQVQLLFTSLPQVSAFLKTGRLRLIAAATQERVRFAPEFEPIAQTLPGFDANTWWGLIAPAGTPQSIINKVNADLNRVLADDAVQQRLHVLGVEPRPGTPKQFWDLALAETERWRKVIKTAGIGPDVGR